MSCRWIVPVVVALWSVLPAARADAQPLPAASGRVLEASDGDVVGLGYMSLAGARGQKTLVTRRDT